MSDDTDWEWALNPTCRAEEERGVAVITGVRLRNEIAWLTNEVATWKDRALKAESVIAQRDASVFTATGKRLKRGVQFGGVSQ